MPASDGFSTRKLDVGDGLTITVRCRPTTFGPFFGFREQPEKLFDPISAIGPCQQELCCLRDSKADAAQKWHGALSEDKHDAQRTVYHSPSPGTSEAIVDGKPPPPSSDVGVTREHNSYDRTGLLVWPGSRLLARFLVDPRGARRHWPHLIPAAPDGLAEDCRGVADDTAASILGTETREQEGQHQRRESAAADIDEVISLYTRSCSSGFVQGQVMVLNEDDAGNRTRDGRCQRCAPNQLTSTNDPIRGHVRKSNGKSYHPRCRRCLDNPPNTTSAAAAIHSFIPHDVRDLPETLIADDEPTGSTEIVQHCPYVEGRDDYTQSSFINDKKNHPLPEAHFRTFGRRQQLATAAERSTGTKEKNCEHCVERRSVHLSVLELGAGTGVCGLTAAIGLECCSVLVTDRSKDVLHNVRYNVTLNGLGDRVRVARLEWGGSGDRSLPQEILAQAPFKIILASDTVYPGKPWSDTEAFFAVVKQVLDPDGVLLFAYTPRPPSIVTEKMLCCAYLAGLRGERLSYRVDGTQCSDALRNAPESVAVAVTTSSPCPRGGSNASPLEGTLVARGGNQTQGALGESVERLVTQPNLTDGHHDYRVGRKEKRRSIEQDSRYINTRYDQRQRMQRPDDVRTITTSCSGDAPCELTMGGVSGGAIDDNTGHQRKRPTKFGRKRNDQVPPLLIAFRGSTTASSMRGGTRQEDDNTAAESASRRNSVARWTEEWREIFPLVHFRPTPAIAKSVRKMLEYVESLSDGREGRTWAVADAFSSEMGREGVERDVDDDCTAEELWGSGSDSGGHTFQCV